ncbi:unnamed protein product [Microthlaspi erraticum]|uniref:Uncharacterized protein n=1 Tax=Microthlaspi erraticum TaxID=1685480 RepID=A0A6D2KYE4_9BRAS|nr:unnamed protein product [Microthlaspi erraticum]
MPETEVAKAAAGGEDRISELSDDLLIHILLLVPTKDAVTTTFLSRRWRFVWRKLPRLDYRETRNNGHDTNIAIARVFGECPTDVDVVKWVAKAVDRYVLRKLEFELRWNNEPMRMPSSLYTCETLTKLILADKVLVDVPCPVYLPSLHQLELLGIVYKDEDSHVRLLSGCPVLKRLRVYRQDDVDDNVRKFTVKVPSLLELEYMNTFFGEDDDDDRASVSVKLKLVDKFLTCLSSIKYLKLHHLASTLAPWCNVVYSLLIECRIEDTFVPFWSGSPLGVLLSNCPKLKVFAVDSIYEEAQYESHDPVLWKQPSSVPK